MKHNYLFLLLFLTCVAWKTHAQLPNLPVKAALSTTLSGSKTFNNSIAVDTIALPLSNKDEFTLDVNVQVNSAVGRGFDVEFNNEFGFGLRTSLDKTQFNNSSSLSQIEALSSSVDYGQAQTYRYAVKDGMAHIYLDGHFLASKTLTSLLGNTSQELNFGTDNYLGAWAGSSSDNSGAPSDYGWANTYSETLFNTANAGGGVRYMDVTSGHTYESDGSTYNGRLMYIRWDGNSYTSSTYSFPIELENGYQYELSLIYELLANGPSGRKINVAISENADGTGTIVSKSFTTGGHYKLRSGSLDFLSQTEGTHYVTITGEWALFGIGELKLSSTNLINAWDGLTGDNANSPDNYGWANTSQNLPWAVANNAGGVRYMDITSGHTYESDNSIYNGRLMYIRWDSNSYNTSTYSYPITLESGQQYKLSLIYELIANAGSGAKLDIAISENADGSGTIASKSFTTGNSLKLRNGDFNFTSQTDGTYYVTITGDWGLFGIGELEVKNELGANIIIGKNYADGAVDIVVNSVTYDDVAYSPVEINSPSSTALSITNDQNVGAYSKSQLTLSGSTSLYLNNAFNPLINTTVDIISEDARIVFENVDPETVTSSFLNAITINGAAAAENTNITLLGYGAGTAIVTHTSDYEPLEVFTEENFGGTSQLYQIVTPYTDLGTLDNNLKSFKLKKGYMATFASNSDGTGYSRVYIAQDNDLEVAVLPPYLNGTVSFIRTMRWNDPSKKGWCGSGTALSATKATNSTWRYNWDTGSTTTPSTEYVPMRHNYFWPSFGPANNNAGYTHFLGYNEPDRPDQANIPVETAIEGWPDFLQSGLRLGSPSTSDPFNPWLGQFMDAAEEKNYRVDYMAIHCYWYKSAAQWKNDLENIYNRYNRPIWITEWNIGANWTGNSFPDGPSALTDANATKHKNDLIAVLDVLDNADYVERYSIYNWVQDARAMIVTIDAGFIERNPDYANYQWLTNAPIVSTKQGTLPDGSTGDIHSVLTPAGQYYANNASKKAYNPNREYITSWTPKVETLTYTLSPTFENITINWTNENYDLINKYVLERKLENETEFSVFFETTDYNITSTTDVINTRAEYRIKAIGKDGTESDYSTILEFIQSETPNAPTTLTGEALSSTIIKLTWDDMEDVDSYSIKRANTINGTYTIIASPVTGTSYEDTGLSINTSYHYQISASNSGGESDYSTPISVTTLEITIPVTVTNIVTGSGDGQVKLEWDSMYDADFYVKRSTSESGPFTTIATISENSYVDTSVANGTVYYYTVSAFNSAGEGNDATALIATPNLGQHAYYDFEENSGSVAQDKWNFYTADLYNSTWTQDGQTGNGVNLDKSLSSYIDIKDGVVETLNDFTISTWIKLDTISNWTRVFDFGKSTSTYMFLTPQNGNSGTYRFGIKNEGTEERINTTVTPTVDVWTHIVVTLDGAVGIMYIDGVEVGRNDAMTITPSILGTTTNNYIGKSQWPDPYFDGTIDEFTIYNRALSSSEINNLMSKTLNTHNTVLNDNSKYIAYTANNTLYAICNNNEDSDYTLYSISGQLISKGKLHARGVNNLGTHKTGLYIIQIKDANGIKALKVIVRRSNYFCLSLKTQLKHYVLIGFYFFNYLI